MKRFNFRFENLYDQYLWWESRILGTNTTLLYMHVYFSLDIFILALLFYFTKDICLYVYELLLWVWSCNMYNVWEFYICVENLLPTVVLSALPIDVEKLYKLIWMCLSDNMYILNDCVCYWDFSLKSYHLITCYFKWKVQVRGKRRRFPI